MAAIFDLPLTLISKSVHTSTTELLDLENVDVALEILLISSIEAEILRYLTCNSGNGSHLRFTTYPDVGECSHYFHRVAGPRKCGCSSWNLLISCIEAEVLRCFISTSGFWQSSLICDSR